MTKRTLKTDQEVDMGEHRIVVVMGAADVARIDTAVIAMRRLRPGEKFSRADLIRSASLRLAAEIVAEDQRVRS